MEIKVAGPFSLGDGWQVGKDLSISPPRFVAKLVAEIEAKLGADAKLIKATEVVAEKPAAAAPWSSETQTVIVLRCEPLQFMQLRTALVQKLGGALEDDHHVWTGTHLIRLLTT